MAADDPFKNSSFFFSAEKTEKRKRIEDENQSRKRGSNSTPTPNGTLQLAGGDENFHPRGIQAGPFIIQTPPAQVLESDPKLRLPPFSAFEAMAEQGEKERRELAQVDRAVNGARVIYSSASGSAMYSSPRLSLSSGEDAPENETTLPTPAFTRHR